MTNKMFWIVSFILILLCVVIIYSFIPVNIIADVAFIMIACSKRNKLKEKGVNAKEYLTNHCINELIISTSKDKLLYEVNGMLMTFIHIFFIGLTSLISMIKIKISCFLHRYNDRYIHYNYDILKLMNHKKFEYKVKNFNLLFNEKVKDQELIERIVKINEKYVPELNSLISKFKSCQDEKNGEMLFDSIDKVSLSMFLEILEVKKIQSKNEKAELKEYLDLIDTINNDK